MLTQREFAEKVKKIIDNHDTPIGATEGDMIRFKTHEIMRLAEIRVNLREE